MTVDTTNRSDIRVAFADLLRPALVGSGKPADAVYEYQVADFQGKLCVVVITGSGTGRGKPSTEEDSHFYLEVHSFVLYAIPPVQSTSDLDPGLDVQILLGTTTLFEVGQTVTVRDSLSEETAVVTDVLAGSITVDALTHSYTTPKVSIWTELQSEDTIDLVEKIVSDVVVESNDADGWLELYENGDTVVDVVDVGGNGYRHETIPIRAVVPEKQ